MKNKNTDYFEMLKDVRKSYIEKWTGKERQDPYKFEGWFEWLTPIERNVWHDIRVLGLPFYPQFPIGRYYADFADPFKKFVIEVDGRIHNDEEVAAKDKIKQTYLESRGWTVIRIPGFMTYRSRSDYERDDEVDERYYTHSSEGILADIRHRHYRKPKSEVGSSVLICSLDIVLKGNNGVDDEQLRLNKLNFAWQ